MPQMELASDVRRGHDNDEGLFAGLYLGSKVALFKPELIPFLFYPAWLIGSGYLGH
jgi:hypothetical protein